MEQLNIRWEGGESDILSSISDPYERMCVWLYAYRFGTISFLELVALYEETLGITPPHTEDQERFISVLVD